MKIFTLKYRGAFALAAKIAGLLPYGAFALQPCEYIGWGNWVLVLATNLTRKYLWNTNRPQPPPNSKGYGFSGCSISQNSASVIFRGYMNSTSVDSILPRYFSRDSLISASVHSISPSVIFRGYLNSVSVILIYPRNYRGFRPLCYTLGFCRFKINGQKAYLRTKTFHLSL